ncbi:3-isopropylmalate dehydratase small subunit [Sphingobium sp. H39-3-25]|uniref:3-isopropylmalate dehydratase small subunit n=1 Tax=Sphingobium arseniciresistens TaxID=3030834 RepID=UPI0023B99B80|nr:3-isopropylmalate dehydratase small subunit [Sphingobium arseniciresistens]
MEKFTSLTAIAAPLPQVNINTDAILPARYLKTVKRSGLGGAAFYTMRFDENGAERPDFVLNQGAYRNAQILITGANFGCGSSREHAPWALADFGIRCIIAPSFADIFYHNCFKNGMLCITLPQAEIDLLIHLAESGKSPFVVDLEATSVTASDGSVFRFEIDPTKRDNLLKGLDEIEKTRTYLREIADFEDDRSRRQPWAIRKIEIF